MKTLICILCTLLINGCTLYKVRRCPDNATTKAVCSSATVLSNRKFAKGIEFIYISPTAKVSLKADKVERDESPLEKAGAGLLKDGLSKYIKRGL